MAKQVINNDEKGLVVRAKLNENFTEVYDNTDANALSLTTKSDINHNHDGIYEPADPLIQVRVADPHDYESADPAIQIHINSPHAPANANYYVHPATHPHTMITGLGTAATEYVGTSANQLIQLDVDGKIPAVDGSALTGVSHLTQDETDAITGSSSPSSSNPFATSSDVASSGDMDSSIYDPSSVSSDVFSMGNMVETLTEKVLTNTERSQIASNSLKTGITISQAAIVANADTHMQDTNNPHAVSTTQLGLENVDNTSDLDKPISTDVQNALDTKSNTDHNHNGVYEPADPAIQVHITSPHAPADAQKNSDILKSEIENVLTGTISSHDHVYTHTVDLTPNETSLANSYDKNNQTLLEMSQSSNWDSDGVIIISNAKNKSAELYVGTETGNSVPTVKSRTAGLSDIARIEYPCTGTGSPDPAYFTPDPGTIAVTDFSENGFELVVDSSGGTESGYLRSNFFWLETSDIDLQFDVKNLYSYFSYIFFINDRTANSYFMLDNDTDNRYFYVLDGTTKSITYRNDSPDAGYTRVRYTRQYLGTIGSYNEIIYMYNYTTFSWDNVASHTSNLVDNVGNCYFCPRAYSYYSSHSKYAIKGIIDLGNTATFTEDIGWTPWVTLNNNITDIDALSLTDGSENTLHTHKTIIRNTPIYSGLNLIDPTILGDGELLLNSQEKSLALRYYNNGIEAISKTFFGTTQIRKNNSSILDQNINQLFVNLFTGNLYNPDGNRNVRIYAKPGFFTQDDNTKKISISVRWWKNTTITHAAIGVPDSSTPYEADKTKTMSLLSISGQTTISFIGGQTTFFDPVYFPEDISTTGLLFHCNVISSYTFMHRPSTTDTNVGSYVCNYNQNDNNIDISDPLPSPYFLGTYYGLIYEIIRGPESSYGDDGDISIIDDSKAICEKNNGVWSVIGSITSDNISWYVEQDGIELLSKYKIFSLSDMVLEQEEHSLITFEEGSVLNP